MFYLWYSTWPHPDTKISDIKSARLWANSMTRSWMPAIARSRCNNCRGLRKRVSLQLLMWHEPPNILSLHPSMHAVHFKAIATPYFFHNKIQQSNMRRWSNLPAFQQLSLYWVMSVVCCVELFVSAGIDPMYIQDLYNIISMQWLNTCHSYFKEWPNHACATWNKENKLIIVSRKELTMYTTQDQGFNSLTATRALSTKKTFLFQCSFHYPVGIICEGSQQYILHCMYAYVRLSSPFPEMNLIYYT